MPRSGRPDVLRPALDAVLEAWATRVRASREQIERCRESEDPADADAPFVSRFRVDPRRNGDVVLEALRELARPDDMWLDIGAGVGRFALPMALVVRGVHAIDPSAEALAAGR